MAAPRLKWTVDIRPTFKRPFKNLSDTNKRRVLEAIKTLQNSEEPERLGQPLGGKFGGILKCRIGKVRILYSVERDEGKIVLLDLGQRESVYGR